MRFVIWGAGKQGRALLRRLNKELVVAWIDLNHVGEVIDDLSVINYQTYCELYYDCLIIVSPIYQDNIQSFLVGEKKLFISYNDTPNELSNDSLFNGLIGYLLSLDESVIMLYGLSVYAIILYIELQKNGKEVEIVTDCNSKKESKLLEKLKSNFKISEYNSKLDAKCLFATIPIENKGISNLRTDLLEIYHFIPEMHNSALEKFRNIHKGKGCFIIATGPSITISDLNKLNELKQICFSMNKIFYAFDQTTWRPDYYMVSDPKITSLCKEEIRHIDCVAKFVTDLDESFWSDCDDKNTFWIHEHRSVGRKERFSTDVSLSFEFASTVTFLAIQLAVYMGFDRIYLLGVDHSGGTEVNAPERHFYRDKDTKSFYYKFDDESLKRLEYDYVTAKNYADNHGIRILNVTRGGNLNIFERADVDEVFKIIQREQDLI